MSERNSLPAPTMPSPSVAPGEGVQQAAGGGVVPVRRPVRARVTWILSTAFGAGGWLLIFAAIALYAYYLATGAKDGDAIREYRFGYGIGFILVIVFFINVIGACIGLIDILRSRSVREAGCSAPALLLNVVPWVIIGVWIWLSW